MKRSIENRLMLLNLIGISEEYISERKLSHIVFILQCEGRKEKRKTFNYEFIKWNHEAYCNEIGEDLKVLINDGLIKKNSMLMVTEEGRSVLKQTKHYFEKFNLDSYFKYFVYLYFNKSLYHLTEIIYRRYDLVKISKGEVILEINSKEYLSSHIGIQKKEISNELVLNDEMSKDKTIKKERKINKQELEKIETCVKKVKKEINLKGIVVKKEPSALIRFFKKLRG